MKHTAERKGWNWAAVPAAVITSTFLTHADVRVYAYLLWRAGHKDHAWPTADTVAKDLSMSNAAVRLSYRHLVADHWIRRIRRVGHASRTYIFETQKLCLEFAPSANGLADDALTGEPTIRQPVSRLNKSQVNESQVNSSANAETAAPSPSTPDLPPPPQGIDLESKKQESVKCPWCGDSQSVNLRRPACTSCGAEFEYRIDGVSLKRFLPRTPGALLLREQTMTHVNFRVRWGEFASEAERALWEETEAQYGLEALRGWIDWAVTKAIPKKRLVQAITSALRQHGAVRTANEQAAATPEQVNREREATKATDRMLDAYK